MTRLVQDREQAIADVVLLDAGGDAHVARGEPGAEGVVRLVEAAAIEVVAEALDHGDGEVELRLLREICRAAPRRRPALFGDGSHDGHQLGAQLLEEGAYAGDRHALVRTVDQRIGDVLVGAQVVGILATEVERLLQVRAHGGEVVGGPGARPGVVGGRAHLAPAGDELGGHADGLAVIAPHDADEAGVVRSVGQGRLVGLELIEQLAERGVGELLVRQPRERGALPGPRGGTALGHVGCLVPAEHGAGRAEIGNLEQAALQLRQPRLGRGAVGGFGRAAAGAGSRSCLAGIGPSLGHACLAHE